MLFNVKQINLFDIFPIIIDHPKNAEESKLFPVVEKFIKREKNGRAKLPMTGCKLKKVQQSMEKSIPYGTVAVEVSDNKNIDNSDYSNEQSNTLMLYVDTHKLFLIEY